MTQQPDFGLVTEWYHVSKAGMADPLFSVKGPDLLDDGAMKQLLEVSSDNLSAIGPELPASFIGNTLFGLVALELYFLSFEKQALHLQLDHVDLQGEYDHHHGHLHGGFRIRQLVTEDIPEEDTDQFVIGTWTQLCTDILAPLVRQTASVAGVKPELIWNQYGGQLLYVLDFVAESDLDAAVKDRVKRFGNLLKQMDPSATGTRRNPFVHNPRYVDNPWNPAKPLMIRSSCCMYDKREGGDKCYNCPMLTPEEREKRKEQIILQLNGK